MARMVSWLKLLPITIAAISVAAPKNGGRPLFEVTLVNLLCCMKELSFSLCFRGNLPVLSTKDICE